MDDVTIIAAPNIDEVTILVNSGGSGSGGNRPTPGTYEVGVDVDAPTAGLFTWTRSDFANKYVVFTINNGPVYQKDMSDGNPYMTKSLLSDTLTIGNYTGGWQPGDIINLI